MKYIQNNKKQIKPAEKIDDVINYGLWHLGRREHSINELKMKLARKTENKEWIEETIIKLQEMGYLSEERFLENTLQTYHQFKNYGPMRIKQELKLKGVNKELIESAIEDSEVDYYEAALECLNRKCREPIQDRKDKDRLTRYLISKGFSFDMIKYAFEEHLKERE